MNIENYKYTQYASKSESNLRDELDLLRAIDAYNKGENVDGIDKVMVQDLAEWIYKTRPDRNEVSDEKVMEILQTTDYQKAWLMKDFAYYEVGRRWSKNKDLHDLKDLEFIEENMNHGFYLSSSIKLFRKSSKIGLSYFFYKHGWIKILLLMHLLRNIQQNSHILNR